MLCLYRNIKTQFIREQGGEKIKFQRRLRLSADYDPGAMNFDEIRSGEISETPNKIQLYSLYHRTFRPIKLQLIPSTELYP